MFVSLVILRVGLYALRTGLDSQTNTYIWHKINGQIPHWNEEHTGNKYSIVLYRSGAKRKKVEAIIAGIKNKGKDKEQET